MNAIRFAFALVVTFLLAVPLWGAPRYGDATIESGSMTVVRDGRRQQFTQQQGRVPINQQDLIRVGPKSRVRLKTTEKAIVTLGSNAVMHIKPWRRRQESGFLRGLFGKFRALVTGLAGAEKFAVKTATATIGVKGTEFTLAVSPAGDAWVTAIESVTELTGLEGFAQSVTPGTISVVIAGKPATAPAPVPQAMQTQVEDLDSPEPTAPEAQTLPGATEMVEAGIVTEADVEESKQEDGTTGAGETEEEEKSTTAEETKETVTETVESVFSLDEVKVQPKANLSTSFEK